MTETATEISAAGYTNLALGTLIATNWTYLEFRDVSGGKITRIANDGVTDTRIVRTIDSSEKYVQYVCSFSGSATTDSDIATYMTGNGGSCTFKTAVFKNANTDGDSAIMSTDDFTTATIASEGDTLTITVKAGVLPVA